MYEFLFSIIDLKLHSPLPSIGGVEIFPLDQSRADAWFVAGQLDCSQWFQRTFIGRTVALVRIDASYQDEAMRGAQKKIVDALKILQLCFVESIEYRVHVAQLRQRPGEEVAVKVFSPSTMVLPAYNWAPNLGALELDSEGMRGAAERIVFLRTIHESKLPKDFAASLSRGLLRIASSYAMTEYDDQITAILSGMEAMLTTRDDGSKSAALALRTMLLSHYRSYDFPAPERIVQIYRLRNRIQHEAAELQCSRDDAFQIQKTSWHVIICIVEIVAADPRITSRKKLIAAIQKKNYVQEAIQWLQQFQQASTLPELEQILALATTLIKKAPSCMSCGSRVQASDQYCRKCGAQLGIAPMPLPQPIAAPVTIPRSGTLD